MDRLRERIGLFASNESLLLTVGLGVVCLVGVIYFSRPSTSSSAAKSSEKEQKKKKLPVAEKRDYTYEELKKFDGSDLDLPILLSVKSQIYDVTAAPHLYGPEGSYSVFAGHDCSLALAKLAFDKEYLDQPNAKLSPGEQSTLDEWESTFVFKYPLVGKLITPSSTSSSTTTKTTSQ